MIERPTILEIGNVMASVQKSRDTWHGNSAYARFLDVELHALKLLLIVTKIENEETNIAASLGMGAKNDDGRDHDPTRVDERDGRRCGA